MQRVREWRARHPGYWRRRRGKTGVALQETLLTQTLPPQKEAKQDEATALQDLLKSQDPLVLGLVMHVADIALQEDIVGVAQRLISKGRTMMGGRPHGPIYEKQNRDRGAGEARAVAI